MLPIKVPIRKGRAAAQIAVNHFSELSSLPEQGGHQVRDFNGDGIAIAGISTDDLDTDLTLLDSKNLNRHIAFTEAGEIGADALALGFVAGSITLAALCLEIPPVAGLIGTAAVGVVAGIATNGRFGFQTPSEIRADASVDQQTFANWLELQPASASK